MDGIQGFMYPNEMELQWSILIVLYPFITGLVAGAFILASLERVFDVEAVKPTYRLALLTALAFMLVAPLPLQLHLGHPERSFEMYLTPHTTSAMAMFGFVYLWYLMAVLVVEIWLEYRKEIVVAWQQSSGLKRMAYGVLALGSSNISPESLRVDDRVGRLVTIVGIPSAFLLHGYVGFIFGSVKANPWWSTPMMPIVFLFSAIVSGIALVLLMYMGTCVLKGQAIDMPCADTVARYLLYAFIVDFALEMIDLLHRIYEADESFQSLDFMVHTRLYTSHIVVQIVIGTLVPIAGLASRFSRHAFLAGRQSPSSQSTATSSSKLELPSTRMISASVPRSTSTSRSSVSTSTTHTPWPFSSIWTVRVRSRVLASSSRTRTVKRPCGSASGSTPRSTRLPSSALTRSLNWPGSQPCNWRTRRRRYSVMSLAASKPMDTVR